MEVTVLISLRNPEESLSSPTDNPFLLEDKGCLVVRRLNVDKVFKFNLESIYPVIEMVDKDGEIVACYNLNKIIGYEIGNLGWENAEE
jgi:hypothetical protein